MSKIMSEKATQKLVETYRGAQSALPGAGGWLARRRETAIDAFTQTGLPHRRLEEWKYTDLRQVLEKAILVPAPAHDGALVLPELHSATAFSAIDRYVLVFVNGV
ncbi:MAG TPA: Fe-S cluster assembly protein SufD, partial [Rhodobiaceae bacterium]|nr:Fe-S cluster assembly protein SufD [Rhodobiaceae bacterium]